MKNACFQSRYAIISMAEQQQLQLLMHAQWSRQRENFRNFSYNYIIAEVLVGRFFDRGDTPSLPVHGAGVEARNIVLE